MLHFRNVIIQTCLMIVVNRVLKFIKSTDYPPFFVIVFYTWGLEFPTPMEENHVIGLNLLNCKISHQHTINKQ